MKSNTIKLTFQPTLLDILYDAERNKYVQFIAGCFNSSPKNAMFKCRDIETASIIEYGLHDCDIIEEMSPHLMVIQVIPLHFQKNVAKIDELVSWTGSIIKRSEGK